MADEQQSTEGEQGGNSGFTPPASQEELNRIIADRISREKAKYADYNDLKTKASEFDKLAESQKSETQKAIERAEAAERALAETQSERLRLSVIAKHQIPEEYQDFVSGGSEEELTAKAEKVKSLISDSGKSDPFPKADPSQGAKDTGGKTTTAGQFASQLDALGI
jgi:chromosome segregation ATPase